MHDSKEEILFYLRMNGLCERAMKQIADGALTYDELFKVLFYLDFSIWASVRPDEYERIWKSAIDTYKVAKMEEGDKQ